MIVLDEVTYPVNGGLLDREKLKRLFFCLGSGIRFCRRSRGIEW